MIVGVLVFLLPAVEGKDREILLWEEAVKLAWGVLLLFGGGLALAEGFKTSGLASWLSAQMTSLENLPLVLLLLVLIAAVNFLTEITSNLATTAMILPILAPLALVINIHPFVLMIGATLAASCAFMLPVATPPNAVVPEHIGYGQDRSLAEYFIHPAAYPHGLFPRPLSLGF